MKQYPSIGVGVCIVKEDQILFGKRINSHGSDTWAFPGGHLEFGELLSDCAKREVLEETGLIINNIRMGPISQDLFINENKHYITFVMIADYVSGETQILEPHKCLEWRWFKFDAFPKPLFLTLENLEKNNINLKAYINIIENQNI